MSYLDKLLDGVKVEWKMLGEVLEYEQPSKYLVKSSNYNDKFFTPVLTAGKTFILGFTKESEGIYKASETPVIIFDDFTTANKWVDFDFKVKSSAMKILTSKDNSKFILKFIYYWLNTFNSGLIEGDHKRQWISNYSKKEIPIPCPEDPKKSLEIQSKIVDILDKFSTLTAELQAELQARKSQYEFYRNQLLNFQMEEPDQLSLHSSRSISSIKKDSNQIQQTFLPKYLTTNSVLPPHIKVEWMSLGEIFNTRNGYTPSKADKSFWINGTIPWYRMEDIRTNGRILYDSIQHITPKAVKGSGFFKANSIIMATTATIGEHALLIADSLANQRFTNFSIRESLKFKLLPKFVFYYFFKIDEWCVKNVNISSFPSVDIKQLKQVPFPIPPIKEQERIVSILDKFDTLTTSISEGLPKEIELRQKQYEYYRNLLLSFPKE